MAADLIIKIQQNLLFMQSRCKSYGNGFRRAMRKCCKRTRILIGGQCHNPTRIISDSIQIDERESFWCCEIIYHVIKRERSKENSTQPYVLIFVEKLSICHQSEAVLLHFFDLTSPFSTADILPAKINKLNVHIKIRNKCDLNFAELLY